MCVCESISMCVRDSLCECESVCMTEKERKKESRGWEGEGAREGESLCVSDI